MDPKAREAWEQARPGREAGHRAACVAPWVSLELDPSGWVYACCANQMYPLGRIGHDRLTELWGGRRAQVLRSALERWDLSIGCGSCQWHLEHGRMDPDAAVYDRYPVDGDAPPGPVAMTFALSNRCNLGCAMCTPELSSTLRHRAGMAPLVSPYDDEFFEDLATFLPGLEYAKFLGGEPFLIPAHHRVWDLMDQVGGPPRMQVTTNGTVWNDRVKWILERFVVDITVSIDGVTAGTYEAIRSGASFDAVRANVDRFADACRAAGTELRFCFCLMDQNAHEMGPFLQWAERYDAPVSVNVVSDTGFALHDAPLDRLASVLHDWQSTSAVPSRGNVGVWETQIRQLTEVVAERRAGLGPALRRAAPMPDGFLEIPSIPVDGAPTAVAIETERTRLAAWSGGPVGELHFDSDHRVCTVAATHNRLGIGPASVGLGLGEVVAEAGRAVGRQAWAMGADSHPDGGWIRMIGLVDGVPDRGSTGSVLRIVLVPGDGSWVALVAEDRLHELAAERSPAVAVVGPITRR